MEKAANSIALKGRTTVAQGNALGKNPPDNKP